MLNFLKPIPDCPGFFASYEGEIYSELSGELRKLSIQTKHRSYPCISLRSKGKSVTNAVHIFVAKAWIPNPLNLPTVNHKNGKKNGNNVSNLEWCSRKDQSKHAEETGLINRHKRCIYQLSKDGKIISKYESLTKASEKTGLTVSNISRAASGSLQTAGGFVWIYQNEYTPKSKMRPSGNAKAVDQFTLDGEYVKSYESIKNAAEEMGCSENTIRNVCKGRQKTGKGCKWKFSPVVPKIDFLLEETKDWKILEEFPHYKISKEGRVFSIRSHKILKFNIVEGRSVIKLSNKSKQKQLSAHRLAALCYIPNPNNYPEVNHIDGKRINGVLNNHVSNLEWSTRSKQMQHAHDTGLINCKRGVIQMDLNGNIIKKFDSIKKASTAIGKGAISDVLAGRIKTAGGFKWKYAEQ